MVGADENERTRYQSRRINRAEALESLKTILLSGSALFRLSSRWALTACETVSRDEPYQMPSQKRQTLSSLHSSPSNGRKHEEQPANPSH